MTADNGAVGTQRGTFFHQRFIILPVDGEMSTWHKDVGENAGRSAEHIIFEFYTFIDRNVVLNANAISYLDVIANIHILPERAILADDGTTLYMAEMPNLGTITDGNVFVNVTGWMDCIHKQL
jgi:hypothetical protein